MIVLENGHYYQVRIIPHPQDNHWSLEAVDSMLRERFEVRGLRFDCAGTRRLSATGGHLVEPGDILPTGS